MTTTAKEYAQAICRALKPDERLTISEWAAKHRHLPPDTPEPGPWRNLRTPYLIDIQNTMSPGTGYREGWLKKGHQLGGSAAGENFIGHAICSAAGSMLVVFATLEDARQWEVTRFEEMRRSSKELRRRIKPATANQKDGSSTKLRKKFEGGVMRLTGSNRVGALKSATIRYVKFEEPDEYLQDLDDQGDAITLAVKRTSNFARRARIFGDGTPTVEGASAIDKHFKRGDQRRWHLCCPDCGHAQPLEWRQMRWLEHQPETVQYACISCGTLNTETTWKTRNYRREEHWTEAECQAAGVAHWAATAQGEPGVASWHLPSMVAPVGWRPWEVLAREWLTAQGDAAGLKAFRQTVEGEPYTEQIRATVGADVLQARAERYELLTCPTGGLILVGSVDVQDNRLAVLIRAFGRGEESWGIWHDEIYGDPALPEVWEKLKAILTTPVTHQSGQQWKEVDACAIDSGGHHAEDVYAFCRDAQANGRNWFAIRGAKDYYSAKLGKPRKVDFNWRGRDVPGGAVLRFVGTQMTKNLIDSRLKIQKAGAGYYHFPLGFKSDYFLQMRSERREWRRDTRGRKELWWVAGTGRNEAWDLEVYAYAAFLYCMQGQHAENVWRQREAMFSVIKEPEPEPVKLLDPPPQLSSVRRRRGGFTQRWR